jgi:hypothetical protein
MEVLNETSPMPQCEACIQAKHARDSFPHATDSHSKSLGELIHSDMWGPVRVQSNSGSKYYISFTDDCSRRCSVEFMKQKNEATTKVKQYVTYLKNGGMTNRKSSELITWCKNEGIELQTTAPYSPEQNGVSERLNCTLAELARAMLIAKNLPESLWAEVVAHATYIQNHTPT